MSHHRRAVIIIISALLLDVAAGIWFAIAEHIPATSGVSWALGVATTSGSRFSPVNSTGDTIQDIVQLTIIPLFAAALSLFTTGLTAGAVQTQLDEHHSGVHIRLDEIVRKMNARA